MKNSDDMSTPESASLPRRLLNPRHLPKYLFAAVSLATLGAVVVVIASRKELQARDKNPDTPPARAERADVLLVKLIAGKLTFVPSTVVDKSNWLTSRSTRGRKAHEAYARRLRSTLISSVAPPAM